MYFDNQQFGMRYKNFKVPDHKVEDGFAPIRQLAVPHLYNLTVNPDEDIPIQYDNPSTWVVSMIFPAKVREFTRPWRRTAFPLGRRSISTHTGNRNPHRLIEVMILPRRLALAARPGRMRRLD